jgi:hypothetical protein
MMGLPRKVIFVLAAVSALPALAVRADEAEQRFRELVDRGLVLSTEANCPVKKFQFEGLTRITRDGRTEVEQRIVVERADDEVGMLFLSPSRRPSSLVLNDAFFVVDGGRIAHYGGGHFRCALGLTPRDAPGIDVNYAGHTRLRSQAKLDIGRLAKFLMIEGARYGWNPATRQCWVETPRGSRLELYLDPHRTQEYFPLRRVKFHGLAPGGNVQIEVVVSRIYANQPPPWRLTGLSRDILKVAENVEFSAISTSHFNDLGLTYDDQSEANRRASRQLADYLPRDESLQLSELETSQVVSAIAHVGATDSKSARQLRAEIRRFGERAIWGSLERRGEAAAGVAGAAYDRDKAAQRLELALGTSSSESLMQALLACAKNESADASARVDAIDLLVQFGNCPPHRLRERLHERLPENVAAAILTALVRQADVTDAELARLRAYLVRDDFSPAVITLVAEALTVAGDETSLTAAVESLAIPDSADGKVSERRAHAIAFVTAGRARLMAMLEAKSNQLEPMTGLRALAGGAHPAAEDWPAVLAFCRRIALDTAESSSARILANRIVHRDQEALKAGYADEYFATLVDVDDPELLYSGIWNLASIGQPEKCLALVASRWEAGDAQQRQDGVTLALAAVSLGTGSRGDGDRKTVPAGFWPLVEQALQDTSPAVRRLGGVAVLSMLDDGYLPPPALTKHLAECAVQSEDAEQLALFCMALSRVAGPDSVPPIPPEIGTKAEVLQWYQDNGAHIRAVIRERNK